VQLDFIHREIASQIKRKPLILLLISGSAVLEMVGLALVYPLVVLLFDLESASNPVPAVMMVWLEESWMASSETLLITLIVLTLFGKALFLIAYKYFAADSVLSYQQTLRTSLLRRVLYARDDIVSTRLARIQNGLLTQSGTASSAMQGQFNLIQNAVLLSALLALALTLSFELSIILVIVGLGIYWGLAIGIRRAREFGESLASANEQYIGEATEITRTQDYLRATGLQKLFLRRISVSIRAINRAQIRFVLLNHGTKFLGEPAVAISLVIVLFLGLYFFSLDIGLIVVMYLLIGRIYFRFVAVGQVWQGYERDLVSVRYCLGLLSEGSAEWNMDSGLSFDRIRHSLEVRNVTVVAESREILRGINAKFIAGEVTAVIGKTGAGKTTLLRMLLGNVAPSRGEILIDGVSIEEFQRDSYMSRIGWVPQQPIFFNLTLSENAKLKARDVDNKLLDEYLDRFGLGDLRRRSEKGLDSKFGDVGDLLSGGERQRLALIRELLAQPTLLVIDEGTSALDRETTQIVQREIKDVSGETTVIVSTHDEGLLTIADTVMQIQDGRLTVIK